MTVDQVRIVEVGPRDGLQNEARALPVADRIALVDALVAAGLRSVEAGSFVSPKWVPQMAGSAEVLAGVRKLPGVSFPVLVPNLKGFEAAKQAGAEEVAVFASASESFSRRNINCSIAESLERFAPVMEGACAAGIRVRGYVSCALGCPYEGAVALAAVVDVSLKLHRMGCYEVVPSDTIGVGRPRQTRAMIAAVAGAVPVSALAFHAHDTWGQAVANCLAAYEAGVRVFDGSVGGLGGCPYARGATGNVATEALVYMLDDLGTPTGIDIAALAGIALDVCGKLGREPASTISRLFRGRETSPA
jgi:hydroxymethylglutaryl-CoA lyase